MKLRKSTATKPRTTRTNQNDYIQDLYNARPTGTEDPSPLLSVPPIPCPHPTTHADWRREYRRLHWRLAKLQEHYARLQAVHLTNVKQLRALQYRNIPPLNRMPQEIEVYNGRLAGVQFSDYLHAEASNLCRVGARVHLQPEPHNQYDPNAIGVWAICPNTSAPLHRIGYIRRDDTNIIHSFVKANVPLTTYLHQNNVDAKPWDKYVIRVTAPSIIAP